MGINTAVPTVSAGNVYPAATYNTYLAGLFNGLQSAWTAYTPAWTSSGTAPAVVNGTITGKYIQVGKTIDFVINFTPGSSTTYGTGSYSFSLPPSLPAASDGFTLLGNVQLVSTNRWGGQINIATAATTCQPYLSTSATDPRLSNMSPTVPATFANGNLLRITGRYETA